MTPEEQPFTPQDIDDQIDRLAQALPPSQASGAAASEQQAVNDVDTLYAAEAEELSQALARGRARLMQSLRAQQERQRQAGGHPRLLQERLRPMQTLVTPPPQEKRRFYRIGGLVAAALLVVVIGGLVAGLVLVGHGKTGTPNPARPSATATHTLPAGSFVYTVSLVLGKDGTVSKLDSTTGKVLWTYQTNSPVLDAPVIIDGIATFSTQDDRIIGLDTRTGSVGWTVNVDGGNMGNVQMTLADGVLLYPSASGNGILYALDPADGSVIWQVTIIPGASDAAPAYLTTVSAVNGIIYGVAYPHFANSQPSGLYALNSSTHTMLWQVTHTLAGQYFNGSPTVANGVVYVTSSGESSNQYSYTDAYTAQTGKQLWQSEKLYAIWAGTTVIDNVVYVGLVQDDGVYALNATTGKTLWHTSFGGSSSGDVFQPPVVVNGLVYSGQPQMVALNATDGSQRWQANTGGAFALSNGIVYVLSATGVDALHASDGSLLWHTPASSAGGGGFISSVTVAP